MRYSVGATLRSLTQEIKTESGKTVDTTIELLIIDLMNPGKQKRKTLDVVLKLLNDWETQELMPSRHGSKAIKACCFSTKAKLHF